MKLYDEMMSYEQWNQADNVDIQALQPYTFKARFYLIVTPVLLISGSTQFTLMMIGLCGMGMDNISW
jgi:hypothetical protein